MSTLDRMNATIKHVWSDPRFVAEVEWASQTNSLSKQLEAQIGRGAMEAYVDLGRWPDPDVQVTFTMPPEPPDWDWWEPTTKWRREAARARELDALLAGLEKKAA